MGRGEKGRENKGGGGSKSRRWGRREDGREIKGGGVRAGGGGGGRKGESIKNQVERREHLGDWFKYCDF